MPRKRWFAVAFLVLVFSTAQSGSSQESQLEVSLVFSSSTQRDLTAEGVLFARAADDSSAEGRTIVRSPVRAPGRHSLRLAANALWRIGLSLEGFWSEVKHVYLGNDASPASLKLTLYPTGQLSGRLSMPRGEALPGALNVRFEPTPKERPLGAFPEEDGGTASFRADVDCPVDEAGAWSCELPAGRLDLRLRAAGFVSHYLWGATVPRGRTLHAGDLPLERGASIVGTVLTADDSPLADTLLVELLPQTAGRPSTPEAEQRLRARALRATVNDRGFFHFEAVPPGAHTVVARQPGWAEARLPVTVPANVEAQLSTPLVIQRPAALELSLVPPVDPYGRPWRISLYRHDEMNKATGLSTSETDAQGAWTAEDLSPGTYQLEVESGSPPESWLHREIEVGSGRQALALEIPVISIEGLVTRGDEPLEATLWFGGVFGAERVLFESDETGRFGGYLPHEGRWPVEVVEGSRRLRVSLDPVDVSKPRGARSVELHVAVPNTRITGRVVDGEGEPVPRAAIVLMSSRYDLEPRSRMSQVQTDDEGHFEVEGLMPGPFVVAARDPFAQSDWVNVDLKEDHEGPPLRLVLLERTPVEGRVSSPNGAVPGVQLQAKAFAPGASVQPVETALSGGDGRFVWRLPAQTERVEVLVLPPGYAARLITAPIDPASPFDVAVDEVGGTLVLDLPPAGVSSRPQPFLHHGPVGVPVYWLSGWGRSGDDGSLVLPMMEPGEYRLCLGERCSTGYLTPFGELRLGGGSEVAAVEP